MASATIKARIRFTDEATLLLSTSADLSSPTEIAGTEGNDDLFTFPLTGLANDTTYWFGFDGLSFDPVGTFHTPPAAGTHGSFTVVASGDSGLGPQYPGSTSVVSNAPTWDRMLAHDPLWAIVLGDWHYSNLNTTDRSLYRQAYKRVLGESRVNAFVRQVPTDYLPDDHDFGPNDADGTYSGKGAAQAVYREYVPWDLADDEGFYHTYVRGRTRWIHLDCRSFRSPNGNTDNSSKTRIGATQKQWLKDTLLAATEPVIFLNVMSWWGETTSFTDGWDSFSTERTELANFIAANDLIGRLVLFGADIHELLYDDGTNTNFATGATDPGPPYVGCAPIDASFNHFSATAQEAYQTRRQQYVTFGISDPPGSEEVEVTITGWALSASPGSTSSQVFQKVLTFDAPLTEPSPSGGGQRRARLRLAPPARIEQVTDDGWITILL